MRPVAVKTYIPDGFGRESLKRLWEGVYNKFWEGVFKRWFWVGLFKKVSGGTV